MHVREALSNELFNSLKAFKSMTKPVFGMVDKSVEIVS